MPLTPRAWVQFELECRPFYVAGFNAHDLVPKSLADPTAHKTEGGSASLLICSDPRNAAHVKPWYALAAAK